MHDKASALPYFEAIHITMKITAFFKNVYYKYKEELV